MSIDLDFRPTSYSDFDDPVALALNGINGQMRRVMVRDMLTAQGEQRALYDATLGSIDPELLEEAADPDRVQAVNLALGPTWMGGEYLPPKKRGEVEIARIVLRSTLMDIFSLRARWSAGRYHYRMVDEYSSDFILCRKTSRRTLTLRQVIEILQTADGTVETDGVGMVECWWEQQAECWEDLDACTDFASVESEIYPELATWYEQRAEAWRTARQNR